jgi:hypothetical protein
LIPRTLDRRDLEAVARLPDVVATFVNPTHWYQNASFLLPLVASASVGILGLLRRSLELGGFAAFLLAVSLLMVPIVLAGWRQTATVVALTSDGITALHHGRVLRSIEWKDVDQIGERETQGNIRWQISARDGNRILLDGELDDLPELIASARRLAGLVAPETSGP